MRESACADSPVMAVPGSCVQPFEQYEEAGHIADAFLLVSVLHLVSEMDLYLDMV